MTYKFDKLPINYDKAAQKLVVCLSQLKNSSNKTKSFRVNRGSNLMKIKKMIRKYNSW